MYHLQVEPLRRMGKLSAAARLPNAAYTALYNLKTLDPETYIECLDASIANQRRRQCGSSSVFATSAIDCSA